MDQTLLSWIPVIIMVAGFFLTWWQARESSRARRDKDGLGRTQGLVSTAMDLVDAQKERGDALEVEVDELTLALAEAVQVGVQANTLQSLRSSIENAERGRLEEQNQGLRLYAQQLIGLLPADAPPPSLPSSFQNKISILIVNRDPAMLEQIQTLSPIYPHTTRVATSLEDATSLLSTVHFDVVIVNWGVPTNGAKLYKAIQDTDGGKDIVTILVTGDVAGLSTYVPVELHDALDLILDQRR